jgi:RHS repeat-associated protein
MFPSTKNSTSFWFTTKSNFEAKSSNPFGSYPEPQISDLVVLAANPFGSVLSSVSKGEYRYGFNGKETDSETDLQDYGERIYNSSIAKFLSADPLIVKGQQYPELSPYQFASNTPIQAVDIDGLEAFYICFDKDNKAIITIMPKENIGIYFWGICTPDGGYAGSGRRANLPTDFLYRGRVGIGNIMTPSLNSTPLSLANLVSSTNSQFEDKFNSRITSELGKKGTIVESVAKSIVDASISKLLIGVFDMSRDEVHNSGTVISNDKVFTIDITKTITRKILDVKIIKTVHIDAVDINSTYMQSLVAEYTSLGYEVILKKNTVGGFTNVADPNNPEGINIYFTTGVQYEYSEPEVTYEITITDTENPANTITGTTAEEP